MIINIIVVLLVLGIGYAWMIRGMFSSLIHFLCAVAAGAVAFGVWEPLAVMLIEASPERGFFSFLESIAWGVSLIVPFVVGFVLLRFTTDKLVPNNIRNAALVDYIGGGICGVGTGIVSAGILVIGMGTLRLSTSFMGYQPLWYSTDKALGDGALVRTDKLWIPVDKITALAYGQLSIGTMSTKESLSKWYPELELVGFSTRVSPGEGGGRNAISPDDFAIVSTYTVGDENGTENIRDLLKDSLNAKSQKYITVNSETVTNGYLAGFIVEFQPGAKEKGTRGGQVIISNGQYRLLIENESGQTETVFPAAVISESSTAGMFGRWRFDSPDLFITSVGGTSRISMGFEYVIPQGFTPIGFYAKNIRVNADSFPEPVAYETIAMRDSLILTGALLKGESASRQLNTANMITHNSESVSSSLITKSLRVGQMMSASNARRGFTLNDKNHVVDGEAVYDINEVGRSNAPKSRKLRVEKYAMSDGQKLLFVDVSPDSEIGVFSDSFGEAPIDAPLLLIDDKGNEYEAVGFEYTDSKQYHVRLTKGSTLKGIADAPSLSRSRSDQELRLIFIVTKNVNITHFTVGDIAVAQFVPPFLAD